MTSILYLIYVVNFGLHVDYTEYIKQSHIFVQTVFYIYNIYILYN